MSPGPRCGGAPDPGWKHVIHFLVFGAKPLRRRTGAPSNCACLAEEAPPRAHRSPRHFSQIRAIPDEMWSSQAAAGVVGTGDGFQGQRAP